MDKRYDVIVIGAGPGGYIAAIRAAQLGFKVACIDDWKDAGGKPAPGGTCTNVGCIPSKAMLQSSEHFDHARHALADHGIDVKGVSLDLARMLGRKNTVVRQNNDGILFLFRKNGIAYFNGTGSFAGAPNDGYRIAVTGATPETLIGTHVIIATGSRPRPLPCIAFDEQQVLSNTGALSIPSVPGKLAVVGAGVVGLELGSVWRRLGADVTIFETMPELLPSADRQIADEALRQFQRQKLAIQFNTELTGIRADSKGVTIEYFDLSRSKQSATFDRIIVAIGRVPNTSGLNAQSVGLQLDAQGFIAVDDDCRTNLPNVWAVGDVVRGPMLAHKAEEEGAAVAERIAGQASHVNFNLIPWVIYTSPEIAWVGKTERQLEAEGVAFKSGVFPFLANGRARAMGDTSGMVKFLADAHTDEILGVHIIGPMASELIAEAAVAMAFRASAEDIGRLCHAHPTLSEAMKEAALAVDKLSLNY